LIFILGKRKKLDGASDNEVVVEVPCRLPNDAASVHFAANVAKTLPQSSSSSVPLTKFVDMYHSLVPRHYRGLGWSINDLAESDP
jgi:hypothetical protein